MVEGTCKSNGKLILTEDPLLTEDCEFLEEIIHKSDGKRYLNAIQYSPMGGNFGVPTNNADQPLNEFLPGGIIIRKRYAIDEIIQRYRTLKNIG